MTEKDGDYIDYGKPLTNEQRAANNPLTTRAYKDAREDDNYRAMASIERSHQRKDSVAYADGGTEGILTYTILMGIPLLLVLLL